MALKVYYTPDIKASVGPSKYYGLDGAILKVYIPNESTTILAYKVDLQKVPKTLIEKPDTTNLLQRAEYIKVLTKGQN